MAFSINTNNAALEALASLRQTNSALTMTENEVSTGKKVNTASDNPAVYAIAQTMNEQISALAGVSSGLQVSAQVVSMASTQASSSSTLLTNLANTIEQGQTSGYDATTMNDTIEKTLQDVDANALGATFNGVNLLAGGVGNGVTSTTVQSAQDVNGTLFQQGGFNATSAGLGLSGLSVNQSGLDISIGTGGLAKGDNITLSTTSVNSTSEATAQNVANTTSFTMTTGPTDTAATAIQTAISTANAAFDFTFGSALTGTPTVAAGTGFKITSTASDGNGNTVYTATNTTTGAMSTLSFGVDDSGNAVIKVSTGEDQNGNVTAESTFVAVHTATTDSPATTADQMMSAMQNQGFGVSKDSTTGDLQVAGGNLYTGSGTGAPTVTVASDATAAASTETGSTYALLAVNAAVTKINKISSALGSSSNDLTSLQSTVSSLSDALTSGVGALTDADLSAESAQLTSLQTKQQLAIQSLSIANSQSQSLLSLFR